jgi:hypothetical protein
LKKTFIVVGLLLLAFFGYGFIVSSTPEGKARAHERDVIALCWEEQERKSLSPEAARFVAGACEKLEADFRNKWKREP